MLSGLNEMNGSTLSYVRNSLNLSQNFLKLVCIWIELKLNKELCYLWDANSE